MRPTLRLLDAATATSAVPANTAATGSIPSTAGSVIVDGTYFILDDGINPAVQFVFDEATGVVESATKQAIVYTAADTATDIQTAIIAAVNGASALFITATDGGSQITTLTNDFGGTHGNKTVTTNTAIAITGMASGADVGFPLEGHVDGTPYRWLGHDYGAIVVKGAGTGALTFQGLVWLYSFASRTWSQAGIGSTIADRGKLNDGTTITGTTTLNHAQPYQGLSAFDRIYLQVTTISGTDCTVSAYLVSRPV